MTRTEIDVSVRRTTTWRQDLVVAGFAAWMIFGMFLDGRVHKMGSLDADNDSFFSIWHGALYSGFIGGATVLIRWSGGWSAYRRRNWPTVPAGYLPGLLGVPFFLLSGFADMVWHTLWGFEDSLESGLSPPHIGLLLGGMGLVLAPILATAAKVPDDSAGFWRLFPALLSVGSLTAGVISWFNVFLTPLPWGSIETELRLVGGGDERQQGVEILDSMLLHKQMVASVLLAGAATYLLRRWRTPPGSFVLVLGMTAGFNYLEDNFQVHALLPAAFVTGVVVDLVVLARPDWDRRMRVMVVGGVLPLTFWSAYFLGIWAFDEVRWSHQMWSGCIILAGLLGLGTGALAASAEDVTAGVPAGNGQRDDLVDVPEGDAEPVAAAGR